MTRLKDTLYFIKIIKKITWTDYIGEVVGKNVLTVCVSHTDRINSSIKLFNGVVKSLQVSHSS